MKALALVLLFLLLPGVAHAHGARTRYVEVSLISATTATFALGTDGLGIDPEPGCSVRGGALVQLECARGVGAVLVAVTGLATNESAVVVLRDRAGGETTTVVTAASPRITLPGRGAATAVARRYVTIGIAHVLGGLDHVLLLLAIFWGAWRRPRRIVVLVRLATTFTVAHSLSLAATTLAWIHVPSAPAEAAIAASLVLVALDVGREMPAARHGTVGLVALFGLVHGLGFAGALAEVGLPSGAVPAALLAFNVGVEIAQALVLGGCLVVATLAERLHRSPGLRVVEGLTAYAVGITGVFLFFVRTSLFLR